MKKISFLKKVRLFYQYCRTLRKYKEELLIKNNARVDRAYRIYTVINIPPSLIEEPYNLRKEDIDSLAKNYIKDYTTELSKSLNQKNLLELYDFYEVKKVEKYSYLLVYGFSLFNSAILLRNLYVGIFISTILLISLLIMFMF